MLRTDRQLFADPAVDLCQTQTVRFAVTATPAMRITRTFGRRALTWTSALSEHTAAHRDKPVRIRLAAMFVVQVSRLRSGLSHEKC